MKAKTPKTTVYMFYVVVRGHGEFPLDMLRYDTCVPHHQEDVASMTNRAGRFAGVRDIHLIHFSFSPTESLERARWESFDWHVLSVETCHRGNQ